MEEEGGGRRREGRGRGERGGVRGERRGRMHMKVIKFSPEI